MAGSASTFYPLSITITVHTHILFRIAKICLILQDYAIVGGAKIILEMAMPDFVAATHSRAFCNT
jgi:hypothetical protein